MVTAVRVRAEHVDACFDAPALLTIGRDPGCTVVVDHPLVSRHHATLHADGGLWVLEDAGSRNGVFVGGTRVAMVTIHGVTSVRLGDAETGPLIAIEPAADRMPPVAAPGLQSVIHRPEATTVRIGRDSDNDIVIDDDLLVSRHHAEVRRRGDGGWEIVDLRSHNGTFVNGRRIDSARLDERDAVGIGRHVFRAVGGSLEEYVDRGAISFQAVGLTVWNPSGVALLDDVGFALGDRAFLAVVGPSGAGKSTLLNALTGFRPAPRGTVLYDGRDLYADYDDLRARIGFVPQDDILHLSLTVHQALDYAARLRFAGDVTDQERRQRVDEVIVELGLTARRDVPIAHLSGGQRKRVSVALELLARPSLLFLDEPTSGLDPGYERSLMELLRQLADGGRTVVVVTHSVQSLRLCDRVLFLAPGGRAAYFGPPQLALAYFDRDDFQEVFQDLSADDGRDWKARFVAHQDHDTYVTGPQTRVPAAEREVRMPTPRTGVSWGRQVSTLTRRYARVLASDRRNLALLLLQAPVLGALMLFALPAGELAAPPPGQLRLLSKAPLVLFIVTLGGTWIGASNAAREIVKELPILRRERAVGLSLSAYITSKVVVLGALTGLQCALLTTIALSRQDGPPEAVVLGWPLGEMIVAVALAGIAAMALGLLLSAVARTNDQAMTVLPIILILQFVLAAGCVFPELADKPVLAQLSYVSTAQWGFSGEASTSGLNELQKFNVLAEKVPTIDLSHPERALDSLEVGATGRAQWDHTAEAWAVSIVALVALTALFLVSTSLALRRYEPGA
jgi:ABC-type multidrug transport system ATPase subunit/pSer/pThr/pTyr-binding forkhead associated (FHA) protein